MQLRKCINVIPIIAMLAACATPLTPEQRMANFSSQCQAYGFKPQTDPYANCMMKLDAQDQRNSAKTSQCSSVASSAGANYFLAYNACMALTD
jgi:hypothetical protein